MRENYEDAIICQLGNQNKTNQQLSWINVPNIWWFQLRKSEDLNFGV